MKIMVLDNYDSFTYNLVHMLKELTGLPVDVFRNDGISLEDVAAYDKIVISPGPGVPDQAGLTKKLIEHYAPSKSILGVCLGCQAIAEVYGGKLINLERVYHGVASEMNITDPGEKIFSGLPVHFTAGRYHSWVIDQGTLPEVLKVTARDPQGTIMALSHQNYDLKGVQFHPESVLTKDGKMMIRNWLD